MADTLFDPAFLAQLEQLRLYARFQSSGQAGGGRKSRHTGSSVEFSDFREYAIGDDYRRVDWNAYGRFDKLFLKIFMEEKQTRVHILLDASASMDYGIPNKLTVAKRLAAVMVYLALAGYDRVAIFALGDEVSAQLGSFSGKQGFIKALTFLENVAPLPRTALCAAVQRVPLPLGHGVTVLISDLFSSDGYEEALRFLRYRKQETSVIHVLAPEELSPKFEGRVRLLSREDEAARDVDLNVQTLRAYDKALHDFLSDARRACHAHSMQHVLIPSDLDLQHMVFDRIVRAGVVR